MKNKTLFIFGAGSTASLGGPTTEKQNDLLKRLSDSNSDNLKKLQKILDGRFGKDNYDVNDVYNFIDNALLMNVDLRCDDETIKSYDVLKCKRDLITFVFNEFINAMKENNEKNAYDYQKHVDFYYRLAKQELNDKFDKMLHAPENRENFVSNYAIVNFNWDFYSIFAIKEAHERLNHENARFLPIRDNPQLRMYTDFNCESASKYGNDELWYPFTESAAKAVNKKEFNSNRRVVLTKAYFPHGLMNLFKCPKCARHSFYLGDLKKEKLFDLNYSEDNKDGYVCPYCKEKVTAYDFDVLIQSNFKTRNAYFEELRLRMFSEMETAENLVFIGYSMPNDDLDYKTFFKSLNNVKNIYILLKDDNNIHGFKQVRSKDFLFDYSKEVKEAILRYTAVFERKNLFVSTEGFPSAYKELIKIFSI